jgi:hypothetical protein
VRTKKNSRSTAGVTFLVAIGQTLPETVFSDLLRSLKIFFGGGTTGNQSAKLSFCYFSFFWQQSEILAENSEALLLQLDPLPL